MKKLFVLVLAVCLIAAGVFGFLLGKDGTIRSVLEGVNPQGCRVWSFKVPSAEERD